MQDTIKVGFPVPVTGPYGVEAQDQINGAQLAIEEFNDSGGWNGRHAELLVRDYLFDIKLAKQYTEELIVKHGAHVIVGSLKAEDQIVMSRVCHEHQKIFIGISASDALLHKENRLPYTFHEAMSFHMMGGAVGRFAFSRLGSKVAMLSLDGEYGRHSERALLHVGEQIGVNFVKRLYHQHKEADLRSYLREIQKSQPQVVILNNLGDDQVTAVQQCVELGFRDKIRIVVPNFSIANMIKAGGDLYQGVVGSASYYWKLEDIFPSSRRFNDMYRRKYNGAVAGTYGAFGYNGVRATLEAIRLAKSTEAPLLQQALLAMRFDFCKGPQYFRRLDHQSCQCMPIVERKPVATMANENDLFDILDVVPFLKERSFHVSREVQ